jgi:hypothetical protein
LRFRGSASHHDDWKAGIHPAQFPKGLNSVPIWHENVANDQVDAPILELPNAVLAIEGNNHLVTVQFEHRFDDVTNQIVVIDDEYA